jgi:hypothetical protein
LAVDLPSCATHRIEAWKDIQTIVEAHYLFAGADARGKRAANLYSLINSARLNAMDPYLYLRHVLERIAEHPINRIAALLPRECSHKHKRHERGGVRRPKAAIAEHSA